MKQKLMKNLKKIGTFFLSLLTLFSSLFGGLTGMPVSPVRVSASEGTATVSLSKIMSQNGISALKRPASEGLWKISAGGIGTFCLNSGKSMCTGDTVKYRTHNAVTYKNQDIAKALTYYYWTSSRSTKAFALTQAYIWACGAGVGKRTTVYQAGKNLSSKYTKDDAKAFCKKISKTNPKGTIYYYTVTHCVKNKKHDKHQMLYRMTKTPEKPEKDKVEYSASTTDNDKTTVQIRKRDKETGAVLAGATFQFYRDGKAVGTAKTDNKGIASLTYNETIKTGTKTVKKKYIKNWNELSVDQQKDYSAQGYFDSKAKAQAAAESDVNKLLNKIIAEKESQTHTWKAKEIIAAPRHTLSSTQKTKKEGAKDKKVDLGDIYNNGETVDLELNKRSIIEDFGTDATYANAKYGVYAKNDIMKFDNKTVLYKKDSKVTTIITDATGYGCAKKLLIGEYYIKEDEAPEGFEKSNDKTEIALDKNTKVTVDETPIMGQLQIHKTYDDDKKNEAGAVFEVYNSKGTLVDTITTGNDGLATTKQLPYGSYTLRQTKGTAGFSKVPEMTKKIDGTMKTYEINVNNPREAARISITKTDSIKDTQTGISKKEAEVGAKFQIIRKSDKQVVETLTTDENGYASSKALNPGTYTVHQIKGKGNYAFVSDFDVTLSDGDHSDHAYTLDNPWNGKKLMIKKTMEKNGTEEVEAAAEFTVVDAAKASGYQDADLGTEETRQKYINSLPNGAVVGTMTTDAKGTATLLLENLAEGHDFLVIQTKGEEGYDLAPVYDSRDHKAKETDGMKVYEFTAKDAYSDSASIQIKKEKTVSATKKEPEAGAVFELVDLDEKVVATLTTGADGTATAKNIALGTYVLRQKQGANTHQLLEEQTIVLSKREKGKTVTYSYENEENPIDFVLTKRSQETKKLLNDAVYTIYDDDGNEVATLTTGSMKDGYATCKLPYGHYTIKETKAPDGYNKVEESKEFTLDFQSVDYDSSGNGTYQYNATDNPVYGKISLKKTGETLSGYDNGFTYDNDQISGAVYGLYAKEDIKKDDGTVVWKAGTLIDQKTTVKDGVVNFTRKGSDGKETDEFYQGTYYVKEIKGPKGYCIDKEEHEVVLDWDTRPGQMNDIRDTEDIPDISDPQGNNTPYPSSGIYVLQTGEALNEKIQDAQTITFTWEEAPDGVDVTDVSQNQDESVALWKNGNDYYISSQKAGQVIYMNTVSAGMFRGCKQLTKILFKNIDTASVADMSSMFENCQKLKELDLSSFNTSNVEDVSRMFYGCGALKTTYVQDQIVKADDDYKDAKVTQITAVPKTSFTLGDTYHADDFAFSSQYDDDGAQDITDITDDDVSFSPATADAAGNQKVTISFKDSGKYKGYDPIDVTVKVIDPSKIDVPSETDKQVTINLEYSDVLQKYNIHFIKTDNKGNMLPGATFALKAACEIVDKNGKTIFNKGDTISTAVSGDDQFGYLEFFGLPTGIYAKDGVGKEMYTVEEIEAPLGYEKSNEKLPFSGEVLNDQTPDFTHDVASEGNTNDSETTYQHDSKTIVNEDSEYVQVKKNWIDDNNSMNTRPDNVTIKATHNTTGEVKTFVLNEKNNWQMQTDILKKDFDNYTFSEICTAAKYELVGDSTGSKDKDTYAVSFTNKYKDEGKVKLVVNKVWDDSDNSDEIRPDSVKVIVYQNGTEINSRNLDSSNNWTTSFNDLPKYDDAGEKYEYEVKEEATDVINGNSKTGYQISYEVKESTDKATDITTITTDITNTHNPDPTEKSIQKKWDDNKDADGIRPDSVTFNLLGDGKVVDTVTLSEANGWKATSKKVPKKNNGKTINYTWQEVEEGVITGESKIGYKVTYATDKDDPDLTIATNTHEERQPGSVTITKELDPANLNMDIGSAKFTFTLTGTDVYGKKHTYKEDIEFSKNEVEKQLKAHPDQNVKLTATFDDLPYGTYTCSESGGEKYFKLLTLSSDNSNARVDSSKGTVTFNIGPEGTSANAKLTSDATFINQMIRGSVKLVKKDSSGKRLKGVEFTIQDSDGNDIASDVTNENGEIKFDGLVPDTYKITETKTLSGKTLLKEPIYVTIPMTVTQTEVNDQNIDVSNAIKQGNNYYFYHLTYEVSNDAKLNLPTTGGFSNIKTYIPLIGGFAMIIAAIFYYLKKKKGIVIFKKK